MSEETSINLVSFLEQEVYPNLWLRLDMAFPEFGFKLSHDKKYWKASNGEHTKTLTGNPRADRVNVYQNTPFGFKIHGADFISWLSYVSNSNGYNIPRGKEFVECVKRLANLACVSFPEQGQISDFIQKTEEREKEQAIREAFFGYVQERIRGEEGKNAFEYAQGRGFSKEYIEEGGKLGFYPCIRDVKKYLISKGFTEDEIGYTSYEVSHGKPIGSGLVYDSRWEGRIIGVWRDRYGRIRNFWARDISGQSEEHEKYLILKGGSKEHPFGLDSFRGNDAVIVESFMDALLSQFFNMSNVVAVAGKQITSGQVEILSKLGIRTFTFALNSDVAGQEGTEKSLALLYEKGAKAFIASYPERNGDGILFKDAAELIQEKGIDAFEQIIRNAENGAKWMAKRIAMNKETDKEKEQAIEKAIVQSRSMETVERNEFLAIFAKEIGISKRALENKTKTQKKSLGGKSKETSQPIPIRVISESKQSNHFHLTDMGNAQRLVARHGDNIRFCHIWDKWLIWDGACWKIDETSEIVRLAKDTVRNIYAEAAQTFDDEERKAIGKHAQKSESEQRIKAMINLAQSELAISVKPNQLDADPWLLNVKNGTLNLHTGVLMPHKKEDLITKIVSIVYNPEVTCDLWNAFLNKVMNYNKELIAYVKRAIGYSLTAKVNEQCMFFMYGTGKNGKTTFIEIIKNIVGDYWQKAPTEMLMMKQYGSNSIPNDIARLPGARFVVAREVEEGKRLAESLVKDLTGGDTLVARFLHREFFEFAPTHKLWLYGNHKPIIQGTDEGIWRRIHLIPFSVCIPVQERDPKLGEKLFAELSGILAWAVQGCQEWQNIGLNPPQAVLQATKDYREEMDIFTSFLNACCLVEANLKVKMKDLYEEYTQWCEDNGERAASQRTFSLRLQERGFSKHRGTGGLYYWFGLGLLEQNA